ncbi:hypothetical protein GCK72_003877 [Caenorhabditis remanei]|uniref:Uncharacterized protein n=1 Tax=Caenorhabditis remanei TaxID=31234 RepID=A0A6A5HAP0_CAERE|nr:hypothetical protein GCK72_003876 [Caenorhabditis remanei]XP_053588497.1 hypothetical protein GCK72_003877 [Caenorhabditis remanei]KAF1763930.1 hypothetical protein GCK72_003876 [Caenorhabditis remanei]KAF1763931.1 hypothetical protein GCK72_003877 [Caenorhabditis remanei]
MKYPDNVLRNFTFFYENQYRWVGQNPVPGDFVWQKIMPSVVMGNGAVFSLFLEECCRNSVKIEDNMMSFKLCASCYGRNSFITNSNS